MICAWQGKEFPVETPLKMENFSTIIDRVYSFTIEAEHPDRCLVHGYCQKIHLRTPAEDIPIWEPNNLMGGQNFEGLDHWVKWSKSLKNRWNEKILWKWLMAKYKCGTIFLVVVRLDWRCRIDDRAYAAAWFGLWNMGKSACFCFDSFWQNTSKFISCKTIPVFEVLLIDLLQSQYGVDWLQVCFNERVLTVDTTLHRTSHLAESSYTKRATW